MSFGETGWKSWMQLLFGLGLTFLFFYMMAPFVLPILLGMITALLCYPVFALVKQKLPKPLAAFAVTFAVTLGILVPLIFMLISASQQLVQWIGRLRVPKSGGMESLLSSPVTRKALAVVSRFTPIDRSWLEGQLLGIFQSIVENVSRVVANFLSGVPALLLAFFVVVISIYFFLVDGTRFLKFLSTLSPLGPDRSQDLYMTFQKSCRGVVLGLFSSALVQGFLILVFFLATGVPNAMLMAVFGVVMGMVPVVGTAPITIGAVIYLFAYGFKAAGIVMTVGFVVIATVDNVVRSLILKGSSEMHPLLALVSAFGATNLMGPPGIFLGPIIAAVFVSFLRILSLEIRRENILTAAPNPHPETVS